MRAGLGRDASSRTGDDVKADPVAAAKADPAGAANAARSARISELVEREAGDLLDYFLRRTTTAEDAADLLGETLLIVWRRERAVPDDPIQARMWMFGVARKVLSGQHRSRRRREALTARLAAELTVAMPAASTVAVPAAPGADLRDLIERLLDETDQEIIELVYWDGFGLAEAASILGLRPATVRSRHARARAKLRGALDTPGIP